MSVSYVMFKVKSGVEQHLLLFSSLRYLPPSQKEIWCFPEAFGGLTSCMIIRIFMMHNRIVSVRMTVQFVPREA